MSYKLNIAQPLEIEVKRILLERINHSLNLIKKSEDTDHLVHEVRKDMKKVRGLLRLVRDITGKERYKELNIWFRDTARMISDLRDSHVLITTLKELKDHYPRKLDSGEYSAIENELDNRYREIEERDVRNDDVVKKIKERLTKSILNIQDLNLDEDDREYIFKGMKRVYNRGVKAFKKANQKPSDENLHDWRKRVKYLWYQVRLISNCWPGLLGKYARSVHSLSDYLGDDHDLAVFHTAIEQNENIRPGKKIRDKLGKMILKKRAALQVSAFLLGEKIFAEKPGDFVRRIQSYCQTEKEKQTV